MLPEIPAPARLCLRVWAVRLLGKDDLEMRFRLALLFLALALSVFSAFAQDSQSSELSVSFAGNFQKQAQGQGTVDNPSYSAGLLATYRYYFNRWSALEVNYDYTNFTQYYSPGGLATHSRANEYTLAYVNTLGVPKNASIKPFVEAGTGALIFSPAAPGGLPVGALAQTRPVLVFGGGADWRATRWFSLRAGYEGLLYQAPDFTLQSQLTNAPTMMSIPYAGIVFRF